MEGTTHRPRVMVVGPPSSERDSYELVFRRHELDVALCDECRQARSQAARGGIAAVVVTDAVPGSVLDEFLQDLRQTGVRAPIFLIGSPRPESLAQTLSEPGVVLLPPTAPAETLDRLLFPLSETVPQLAPAVELRMRSKTILLHRSEYSLEYRRAKSEFEQEFVTRALEREHGNVSRTARALGMARRNLQLKIQVHRINLKRIREDDESSHR